MKRTLIIAEAGVNHNGDIELAKKLVETAAAAGVDYVKFQTFKASKLVSKSAPKADYQNRNTHDDDTQFTMLRKLELSEEDHYTLIDHCKLHNVKFLSTAFDEESVEFLYKVGVRLFKIPSGELTNLPYLNKVSAVAEEIILSTGMSTMEEIEETVKVLRTNSGRAITVLHCNTEYPTPYSDVNLLAMPAIGQALGVNFGYSDHTLGIRIPIAATAMGAHVIEKHFTLDRTLPGPDHAASIEPDELLNMVRAIRHVDEALGSNIKQPSASEQKNIAVARKSIHLRNAKAKGEQIEVDDLEMLRPGDGISPMKMHELIGKQVSSNLAAGHKLTMSDFE